ncbi:MAG: PIG-L family deacetylase [bacterium]
MSRVLVIAAHLDDEVLGVGGTIQRHVSQGDEVIVLNVSDRTFDGRVDVETVSMLNQQAKRVAEKLGVSRIDHGNQPDKYLDRCLVDTVRPIERVFSEYQPEIVYTHHHGDVNQDHRAVFEATVVAIRSFKSPYLIAAYAYEILSSTELISGAMQGRQFSPNYFVTLQEKDVQIKIEAMEEYYTEVMEYPFPRSSEGIRILAQFRGMQVGRHYAEAFEVIKLVKL